MSKPRPQRILRYAKKSRRSVQFRHRTSDPTQTGIAGSWSYLSLYNEIADLRDSVPALCRQQTAQGFGEVEMVLSGAIDYIMYLEKEIKDEAALLQELAGRFGSSSEYLDTICSWGKGK